MLLDLFPKRFPRVAHALVLGDQLCAGDVLLKSSHPRILVEVQAIEIDPEAVDVNPQPR